MRINIAKSGRSVLVLLGLLLSVAGLAVVPGSTVTPVSLAASFAFFIGVGLLILGVNVRKN